MAARFPLTALSALLVAAPICAAAPQQAPDFTRFAPAHSGRTIPAVIDNQDRVTLRGNVPAALLRATPTGLAPASGPMEKMILSLKMSPDAQYRLAQLTAAQQDPKSPYYHQWLTPEQFGEMFGPSKEDVDAVTSWLMGQGFTIDEVAAGRTTITFSGNVAKVQQAFRATIKTFDLDGAARQGNTADPAIPAALAGVVNGVVSLHNIPRKSAINSVRRLSDEEAAAVMAKRQGTAPNYSGSSNTVHYMAPGDFAAIYNSKALYTAGTPITGTGVNICIVGRARVTASDPVTFRSDFALAANAPTIFYNGTTPAINDNEATEALLDMEWSGATAPGAAIKFISTKSTSTSDGVDLSATYIVNHQSTVGSAAYHASVMSTSFGSCEADMGSTELAFYNNLWSQAASEGISAFVSTGDSGASGCDGGSSTTGSGLGVSGLASTPYNTAVGGTSFREGGNYAAYWNSTNAAGYASALGYIPETTWNESAGTTAPDGTAGSGLWSSSGGVSSTYAKPSWQVAPGVPVDAHRDIPDISLNASSYDGPLIVQTPNGGSAGIYIVGGTSASSPAFAGLAALIVQKTGSNQGNINPRLYQLASAQYTGAGTLTAFHDVTTGGNSVPGVTGYNAGTGYDLATGLGSVDAAQLVNNWVDTAAPSGVTASETGTSGTVTFSGSATDNIGVDHIDFLVDGTVKATASSSPFSATFDSTALTAGSHTLVAKAYDAAGNNASSSGVPFSISNGPTGTFDVLQGGVSVNNSTVSGTVTYSATATSGVGIQRVTFYIDGKFYTSVLSAPYTANLDTTKLENGPHTLLAYAVDNNGIQAYLNPEHTYITTNNVDTIPPTGSTTITGTSGTITFSTTATDQSGIQRVTYYVDGKFYASLTSAPYTTTIDSTKLENGTHSVLTYAVDNAGNLGYLDHGQPFTTNNVDTIPPTGSTTITGTSGTITFSTTATDQSGIQRVTYYLDGVYYASVTSAPYGTTVDSTKLSNGTHYMLTYAVDNNGNLGYLDHGKAFTVSN